MNDFMEIKKDTTITIVGTPPLMRHFIPGERVMPCVVDCPACDAGHKATKVSEKRVFNVIDKQDGTTKQMVMNEKQVEDLIGKVQPKGRCLCVRLGKFEVLFWTMWWNLSWNEKRKVTTTEFETWMFGPWEFRRYW